MNAYAEDLRRKRAEAKERGVPAAEVARASGVVLSSVERCAAMTRGGGAAPEEESERAPQEEGRAREEAP